ncbi:MAG: HD domain-containing protein [Treponema sp.]|jgi:putative hydrolase of HD superfamily|nr:HD domain-containing protein [Treponema sp.]
MEIKINENPFGSYLPSGIERFDSQMRFVAEIDKMTHILRQTVLLDQSRRENDAEHSWHIAVMAQVLQEHFVENADLGRAVRMLTVHDLIEIYAGDTFAYDSVGNLSKEERERKSADKLFAMLPSDQGNEIRGLWEEFDSRSTPDSRFAACMDVLQPFFHNTLTQGHTWVEHSVKKSSVLRRMDIIKKWMPAIWPWVEANIRRGIEMGWLKEDES